MEIVALLRFAEQVVQSVIQQYTQQMNVVKEQAYQPMQQILQQVEGGAWTGTGADAFKEELSSLHMPGVGTIGEQGESFIKNLMQAGQIMAKADQEANQQVQALAEVFQKIIAF
ncbi:MAG TPA: WXG100 family type VII secretion target [Chloroflexota bacterium]|nr:WXG100 family type VII secretion target [Chloroflexota bacterium]